MKINAKLLPVSAMRPMADSTKRVRKIIDCMIAGRLSSRAGSGGRPREMEDLDMKTVVW